ncbi:hypothetical protein FH603_4766 [Spirosoma sp. LMG 31447]|uniref:Uncharacterized protein n=1 Tax=Spirosoma utsteinense TaxID=2585773 RepID=A0ABR6WD66_9BACT|nr:hypothetical protein [Spirosoma utsteinense]
MIELRWPVSRRRAVLVRDHWTDSKILDTHYKTKILR